MDILHSALLALHLLGAAIIIGPFIMQMRAQSGFNTRLPLIGATVQLITGLALVGLAMSSDNDLDHIKIAVKGILAVVIFVTALLAYLRQAKIRGTDKSERSIKPFFHSAGGLAIVNLLVAVFWN
ncbi:hypothetical protein [Humidisolicoccus flavus]|uniref:hypothetical protein n=1 Tax=Humidisolicoccus flavus TaxID=3111414 RepID=UPI003252EAB1